MCFNYKYGDDTKYLYYTRICKFTTIGVSSSGDYVQKWTNNHLIIFSLIVSDGVII